MSMMPPSPEIGKMRLASAKVKLHIMDEENQPLLTDEPVEFEQ
jgi:hypothetical protein